MRKEQKTLGGWSQLRRFGREVREGTYLANVQARKRASRTSWDALGFLVAIPIIGVLWWGGVRLGIMLVHAFRPTVPDAAIGFGRGLESPETFAGTILLLSPTVVSAASAFWLANAIIYSIPRARRAQIAKTGESGLKEAQAGLLICAVLGFAVYVVMLAVAIPLASKAVG